MTIPEPGPDPEAAMTPAPVPMETPSPRPQEPIRAPAQGMRPERAAILNRMMGRVMEPVRPGPDLAMELEPVAQTVPTGLGALMTREAPGTPAALATPEGPATVMDQLVRSVASDLSSFIWRSAPAAAGKPFTSR